MEGSVLALITLLAVGGQQPPAPSAPKPATSPATPAPATQTPARRAAARPAPPPVPTNVEVRVGSASGEPASGVTVTAEGPISRVSRSNAEGKLTLWALTPGTYRVKAEGEGFVAFEKEVIVVSGKPMSVDFALAAAPPPPPPPAPDPPPPSKDEPIPPGPARVLSLLDLAEKSLSGRDAFKTVPVGCSGLSRSELLVVRDTKPSVTLPDADESFYLIAGEATMTVGGKEQALTPGWFSLVPRGTSFSVTRKGRNPAILLMITAGPRC